MMNFRVGRRRSVLTIASAFVVILVVNAACFVIAMERRLRADLEERANLFAAASSAPICQAYESYHVSAFYKLKELIRYYMGAEPDVETITIFDLSGQILLDSAKLDGPEGQRAVSEDALHIEAIKRLETTSIRGRDAAGHDTLEIITPFVEDFGAHRLSVSYHVSYKNLRPAIARLFYLGAGQLLLSILASFLVVRALVRRAVEPSVA